MVEVALDWVSLREGLAGYVGWIQEKNIYHADGWIGCWIGDMGLGMMPEDGIYFSLIPHF
jgi:hypothetical protein